MRGGDFPTTPDGRYFVVRGRLWRRRDPSLDEVEWSKLVSELMAVRRAVGVGLRRGDPASVVAARRAVDASKVALRERGPV